MKKIIRRLFGTKGQIWISAVLYMLIISVAVVIVLNVGLPLLDSMKDKTAYVKTRDTLLSIDKNIEDITAEGEGSQRIVNVEIQDGELTLADGTLVWELKTDADIVEPRSKTEYGNLVVSSDIDVSTIEQNGYYILENKYISVNITKFTSEQNDTSQLINSVKFKPNDVTVPGNFTFMIGNDVNTATGIITTQMDPPGNNTAVDFATVVVLVNSTSLTYELELTLESQSDFLVTKIRNVY